MEKSQTEIFLKEGTVEKFFEGSGKTVEDFEEYMRFVRRKRDEKMQMKNKRLTSHVSIFPLNFKGKIKHSDNIKQDVLDYLVSIDAASLESVDARAVNHESIEHQEFLLSKAPDEDLPTSDFRRWC